MSQNTLAYGDTQYKAMQGQVNIDEAQGIVECFVAGIGNKDSVGDICLPGCFTESLKRRKPRVVWGHNWNEPIGKVLDIYEVSPNDPRLPMKMKRAGIGGLYARVQFNLKSERGRQAFADVSFFGEEQEWSIGYKTLNADYDQQRQANLLKEVELYEVSPVLHGANQLTGTISIKSDDPYSYDFEPEYDEKGDKLRDPKGGLTAAGRKFFARTEGANLKPGVKGPADTPEKMRRKGSFLTRFFTNPSGPMKDENGEPTRLALSAAAWGEPVPQNIDDAKALAEKGRRLLDKYNAKKEKMYDISSRIYDTDLEQEDDDDENYDGPRGEDGGIPAMNPSMGRAANLARALATRFGGAIRLRSADPNLVIFDHMSEDGEKETVRVAYHFDGDEFMFGQPVKVKPETVYLPAEEDDDEEEDDNRVGETISRQYQREMNDYPAMPEGVKPKICKCAACNGGGMEPMNEYMNDGASIKAPLPPDAVPQERITGDVMRGYGPRRGNLERLLRYWRPIMRREGGFRRCRVILADHPELYPLNNICAWLHHETTGLWPNEGCHHPGMKNCRKKIRGITNGSIWNDREWNDRLAKLPNANAGKGLDSMDDDMSSMTPEQVEEKAAYMLKQFVQAMPDFVNFIEDDNNWEHEGDDEQGSPVIHIMKPGIGGGHGDCGCGCGGAGSCQPKPVQAIMAALSQLGKSLDEQMSTKAGKVISSRNMQKLQQAMELLQDVVAASAPAAPSTPAVQVKSAANGDYQVRIHTPYGMTWSIKSYINPVLDFYGIDSHVDNNAIYLHGSVTDEATKALFTSIEAFKETKQDLNL